MPEAKGQLVDFSIELKDFKGESIPLDEKKEPATLKRVCVDCLLSQDSSSNNDATTKLKQFELARRIHNSNGDGLELSSEDAQLIRTCANKCYTPFIYGSICDHVK